MNIFQGHPQRLCHHANNKSCTLLLLSFFLLALHNLLLQKIVNRHIHQLLPVIRRLIKPGFLVMLQQIKMPAQPASQHLLPVLPQTQQLLIFHRGYLFLHTLPVGKSFPAFQCLPADKGNVEQLSIPMTEQMSKFLLVIISRIGRTQAAFLHSIHIYAYPVIIDEKNRLPGAQLHQKQLPAGPGILCVKLAKARLHTHQLKLP